MAVEKGKLLRVAVDSKLYIRLKVLSARTHKRVCDIVEKALLKALPEMELQALADENNRISRPTAQSLKLSRRNSLRYLAVTQDAEPV